MKNLTKKQKAVLIVTIILTVITFSILILYYIFNYQSKNIPKIEYESEDITNLNKYIEDLYQGLDENISITYKKYDNINYVTYLFTSKIKNDNKITTYNYIPVVVDKNQKKDLTKLEIAQIYNYDLEKIEKLVRKQLKKIYKDEINKRFINEYECDFECYLYQYRNFSNIDDIYMLSIENNKLFVYINIINNPYAEDIKYFKKENKLIRFEIK